MQNKTKLLVAGTLTLLVLIIILQNTEVVSVHLLFWEFQMSRVILILLAAFAGFVSGYLLGRMGTGES